MTMLTVASFTAVALSILAKGGTVDQILLNRRNRCCGTSGFSWRRESINAASYGAWVWFGIVAAQWAVIVPQALGASLSGVLLTQVWVDRRRTPADPAETAPLVPEGAAP